MTINTGRGWRWALALTLAAMPMAASAQQQSEAPPPAPGGLQGIFEEPRIISRAIDFVSRTNGEGGSEKSGLYLETSNMITGAGWISAGPGYRQWFGGDRLFVDASAAWSWRSYKIARGRIELANLADGRVAVGSEVKWQDYTQNTYFGHGPDSLETDRSEYRVKSINAVAYTSVRPAKWLTIGGRAGWLRQPTLLEPSGNFRRDYASTQQLFPQESAFALAEQPDYAHGEISITADTRDRRSHPLQGGLCRASWSRFFDRAAGQFSFQRFEAEGAHFLTFDAARLTLAMHGWLVASDTAEGDTIPFYLMPSLGGNNTLRSYANYRFHDRHLAVANVEARVALLDHLDVAVFADAGNVAPRMADLNIDRRSYGAGFRMHSGKATFARVDVAHGNEGWRVTVTTNDPLHLTRLSRRMAPIPFAP